MRSGDSLFPDFDSPYLSRLDHANYRRVLKQISDAHRATLRQVALRFLVRRSKLFAIPKAASLEHIAENAEAGDLHLTEAEITQIDQAFPLGSRPGHLPML